MRGACLQCDGLPDVEVLCGGTANGRPASVWATWGAGIAEPGFYTGKVGRPGRVRVSPAFWGVTTSGGRCRRVVAM
eukprot:8912817-Heterocapsa_arctica.AAC.1